MIYRKEILFDAKFNDRAVDKCQPIVIRQKYCSISPREGTVVKNQQDAIVFCVADHCLVLWQAITSPFYPGRITSNANGAALPKAGQSGMAPGSLSGSLRFYSANFFSPGYRDIRRTGD